MEGLDIIQYHGDGYKAMLDFNGWRVAFLRYAERFDIDHIQRMERHLLTDEVFVLLHGEAALVIGTDQQVCRMEKNTIYNVKQAAWHAICVSRDAEVLIVENANTSIDNTEYCRVEFKKDNVQL